MKTDLIYNPLAFTQGIAFFVNTDFHSARPIPKNYYGWLCAVIFFSLHIEKLLAIKKSQNITDFFHNYPLYSHCQVIA